jgi:uncharacterized membrane protein (UPF0127 family)
MRVVHEQTGRVLATDVEVADSLFSRARGLMFRASIPDDYALVLEMGDGLFGPSTQTIHMLFVRFPIDVVWLVDDKVTRVGQLVPWRGFAGAQANRVLELPAGGARGVEAGDTVRVDGL